MNLQSTLPIRCWISRSGFARVQAQAGPWCARRHAGLRLIQPGGIAVLLLLSIGAQAAEQDINRNWRSIAIKGYDPVAYFTLGKAVEGKSQFEYRWHDARWRFMSAEHLELFAGNPEQYAPRFGGYCAEGMTLGRKASIDPQAWLIVDGELYLNYSIEVRDEMVRHPNETIEKADRVWERLKPFLTER